MACLIKEFQASLQKPQKESDHRHHEQTKSMQVAFFNQVKALSDIIEEMGNPFIDESNDLLVLDTRDLADPSVVNAMYNLMKTQYDTFVSERLVDQTKPVNDPIKRNNFPLFSRPVREKSTQILTQYLQLCVYCEQLASHGSSPMLCQDCSPSKSPSKYPPTRIF